MSTSAAEVPASHRDLLERPLYGHLATIRPDGGVQVNPMWFAFDGQQIRFFLMKGDLDVVTCQSHYDQAQVDANHRVAMQSMSEQHYRMPWSEHVEMRQFRSEIESAMRDGPERFRLTPDQPGSHTIRPSLYRRLRKRGRAILPQALHTPAIRLYLRLLYYQVGRWRYRDHR